MKLTIDDLKNLEKYPGTSHKEENQKSAKSKKILKFRDYHRSYSTYSVIFLFFIFAIIGWLWEVGIHVIEDGEFINRGTTHGPWLPIYGFGGAATVVFFKKLVDRPIAMFSMIVLTSAIFEYITSWYLDKFMNLQYWNYKGYFMNIHGRICLEGVLVFGFAGSAAIYLLAPLIDDIVKKIPKNICLILSIILIFAFLGDIIYSQSNPNKGKGITDYVRTCNVTDIYCC